MENDNLKETEYNDMEYKNLEIRESRIQLKDFNSCTFTKCNFNGTYIQRCRFRDCTFLHCDCSLINVKDSSFANTRFEDSKLTGVNWTQSEWAANKLTQKTIDFYRCVMNFSTFMGLDLEKVVLRNCVAHEVSFEEADLSFADCVGTDFENSRFVRTNLTSADFRGAINYLIDPTLNTLKRTKFSMPEAMSLLYSLNIILEDLPVDEQ